MDQLALFGFFYFVSQKNKSLNRFKEKDGIIKGSAGAVLPVLEITEAQMEQKITS